MYRATRHRYEFLVWRPIILLTLAGGLCEDHFVLIYHTLTHKKFFPFLSRTEKCSVNAYFLKKNKFLILRNLENSQQIALCGKNWKSAFEKKCFSRQELFFKKLFTIIGLKWNWAKFSYTVSLINKKLNVSYSIFAVLTRLTSDIFKIRQIFINLSSPFARKSNLRIINILGQEILKSGSGRKTISKRHRPKTGRAARWELKKN